MRDEKCPQGVSTGKFTEGDNFGLYQHASRYYALLLDLQYNVDKYVARQFIILHYLRLQPIFVILMQLT